MHQPSYVDLALERRSQAAGVAGNDQATASSAIDLSEAFSHDEEQGIH